MPDDLNSALIAHLYARGLLDDKRNRLNQARVGGAAFGMPSMPELTPAQGTGELRSANTPMGDRYAQMFNSPQLGLVMSGVDRAGDIGKETALGLSGVTSMEDAAKNMAEGQQAGDWKRMVGAGLQGASALAPWTRTGARLLYGTMPRAAATGAGVGLSHMAATGELGDLLSTPAEAQTPLTRTQRREMEMERQRAEREQAAQEKKTRLQFELSEKGKQEELARQHAEEERELNLPFKKAHPYIATGLAAAGPVLGALGAGLIKRAGVNTYNKAIEELSQRWGTAAAQAAAAPARSVLRQRLTAQAEGLGKQFEALQAKGPKGSIAGPITGATAAEIGLNAPLAFDYARAVPGSPLEEDVHKNLRDIPGWLGRLALGFSLGGGAGKIATNVAARRTAMPPNYRAETDALAPPIPLKSQTLLPQSGTTQAQTSTSPSRRIPKGQPGAGRFIKKGDE